MTYSDARKQAHGWVDAFIHPLDGYMTREGALHKIAERIQNAWPVTQRQLAYLDPEGT